MITKPLIIHRIPSIIPIKGRGFINQGFGVALLFLILVGVPGSLCLHFHSPL